MSKKSFIFYLFLALLLGINIGSALSNVYGKNAEYSHINIELPEEYELMEESDNIKGEYNKITRTLKIWYNN